MAIALGKQQDDYAPAFGFLFKELPQLKSNRPDIWQAFKQYSHLNDTEALQAVTLNTSAPLIFASALNLATFGQFLDANPVRIEISTGVLKRFESDASNADAQRFLLIKVLHELCHWGCFRKGVVDNDEAGENFEIALFGRELGPWWDVPAFQAPTDVFNDPAARAQACIEGLATGEHVAGKLDDPHQPVFAGCDVARGQTLGYRNNNPGNIRISADAWKGLADPAHKTDFQREEKAFCVFQEPEWGLRALAILLRNYKRLHGLATPRAIINRWAPASDHNDVVSYSAALAKALGTSPDSFVDAEDEDTLLKMMKAIARHENGSSAPYSEVQFRTALLLI